jgi:predicted RNA-binding Zn-ribbon protein involved in translation (DUF1610 family)
VRKHDLRRRARANVGEWNEAHALCLACGWQCIIEYQRPAERWTCAQCGQRELVRDDDEAQRPARAAIEEGEA